ncbi:helicase-associated domain-containing protein [Cohnella mopanensis]|uniref:helicase-associated domain-containing protein n=1 Tax=Cohnella mopanensis TaxID=2911966 RepID=UPI001EF8A1E5|nr:helicase-associated domain-containing protein [Cohnella mopanensis]
MNLLLSVQRLPDSIRRLIASDPAVKLRHDQGEPLEAILGSRKWAETWSRHHSESQELRVLRAILMNFASVPFEVEALSKLMERTSAFTGAEIRVAVTKLRRSGIVYAVRKAWGDQLLYLPNDSITLWQPLLLPVTGNSIGEVNEREVSYSAREFRLPLSLELLSVWHEIAINPIAWTTKGTIHRTEVTRLIRKMLLSERELSCLSLAYPQQDRIPPQLALALDLGLHSRVLNKAGNEIRISAKGLSNWLALSLLEADRRLYAHLSDCYGAINPAIHLATVSILTLNVMEWYRDDILNITSGRFEAINDWLELLQSMGWLERGLLHGNSIFRIKQPFSLAVENQPSDKQGTLFVQPDGEILVPPETGLKERWVLSEIAELVTADAVFVYRLTRSSCIEACNAGYSKQSLIDFLEQGTCSPLPESVARMIEDWYAALGKARFSEVLLLRTDNATTAEKLKNDPELAEKLLEQVGDRDFIIEASSYKHVHARLRTIGFPPLEDQRDRMGDQVEIVPDSEVEDADHLGWIYKRNAISMFEADRSLPMAEELFPGLSDIPATWLLKPRTYHLSTRKELLQQAINWKASVQVEQKGSTGLFVPNELRVEGAKWSVIGQWRQKFSDDNIITLNSHAENVEVSADEMEGVMIVLPSLEEIETN